MKLDQLSENFLRYLPKRLQIKRIQDEIAAARAQIMKDHPVVGEDHEIEQEITRVAARLHNEADDLLETDPFTFAYDRFLKIIRRDTT